MARIPVHPRFCSRARHRHGPCVHLGTTAQRGGGPDRRDRPLGIGATWDSRPGRRLGGRSCATCFGVSALRVAGRSHTPRAVARPPRTAAGPWGEDLAPNRRGLSRRGRAARLVRVKASAPTSSPFAPIRSGAATVDHDVQVPAEAASRTVDGTHLRLVGPPSYRLLHSLPAPGVRVAGWFPDHPGRFRMHHPRRYRQIGPAR